MINLDDIIRENIKKYSSNWWEIIDNSINHNSLLETLDLEKQMHYLI